MGSLYFLNSKLLVECCGIAIEANVRTKLSIRIDKAVVLFHAAGDFPSALMLQVAAAVALAEAGAGARAS